MSVVVQAVRDHIDGFDQVKWRKLMLDFGKSLVAASVALMFAPLFGAKIVPVAGVVASFFAFIIGAKMCSFGLQKGD
ncbi:hypothetical protein [Sinimarinibacterium sp. NLF-5-8]|uniref:hypothetical protein n=1 Tax=Sinimarinibacterium sp. NLF-5-8 TaxID=2698684 RepID=UPI00137BBF5B|nr:hypothetical protein [Sinimarinibacterium sp. NLF-5-8]QHS09149.1 hypothetical protein GT972_02580 [Sinimarinibacterium sp. NLF-5-8]